MAYVEGFLRRELEPFSIEQQLALDKNASCIVINVGVDEHDTTVKSFKHLDHEIKNYVLPNKEGLHTATKLYVLGDWVVSYDEGKVGDIAGEASDTWTFIENYDHRRREALTHDKTRIIAREEYEWRVSVGKICQVIAEMENLKELTWISSLPFMGTVLEVLPRSMTKLVFDVSQPVTLDVDDDNRPTYVCYNDMKALREFRKLVELRIFGMQDSFQSIIWETVFRNRADENNMRVLELHMAKPPLIRAESWAKSEIIRELNVPIDEINTYKGYEGRGYLHHQHGTGEYLDDLCMRKARLASGLPESKPLPLWVLKLDGFVIDHLPFEHELSQIALLGVGGDCYDAGLRAPKTENPFRKWDVYVEGAATHCLINFPYWAGIFDPEGRHLCADGKVIVGSMVTRLRSYGIKTSGKEPVGLSHDLTVEALKTLSLGRDTKGVRPEDTSSVATTRGSLETETGEEEEDPELVDVADATCVVPKAEDADRASLWTPSGPAE